MSGHELFSSIHDRRAVDYALPDGSLFEGSSSELELPPHPEVHDEVLAMPQAPSAFSLAAAQRVHEAMSAPGFGAFGEETTMGQFAATGRLPGGRRWLWGREIVKPETVQFPRPGSEVIRPEPGSPHFTTQDNRRPSIAPPNQEGEQ